MILAKAPSSGTSEKVYIASDLAQRAIAKLAEARALVGEAQGLLNIDRVPSAPYEKRGVVIMELSAVASQLLGLAEVIPYPWYPDEDAR